MRAFKPLQYLIFCLIITCPYVSLCQHIPVAILLNQQQDPLETDLSSSLDPILSELALHLDQQYAPVLASRQLLHALIRAQHTARNASNHTSTHLGRLSQLLKHYAHAYDPHNSLQVTNWYIGDENTLSYKECSAEKFPQLFETIQACIEQQSVSVQYLFLTALSFDTWQVFKVLKNDVIEMPLYLLLPPSAHAATVNALQKTCARVKHVPHNLLIETALNESIASQQEDTRYVISARVIGSALKDLRTHMHGASSTSSFIITLGGHGRYTRSSYGIVADRLKPTNVHELASIDQAAREPHDTASCIAALSIKEFQKLLTLLNNTLATSFLYYDSCYTGNNHLLLPYIKKDGSPKTFTFTLATANADSGVSKRDAMQLGINPAKPTHMLIKCPMNPKRFFENVRAWLTNSAKEEQLRSVLLPMLGAQHTVASMVRAVKSKTFTPHLAAQHIKINAERSRSLQEVVIQEQDAHLFLEHNRIISPICGYIPQIRSLIPTNSVHYIYTIECIDLKQRTVLEILTHMFFHPHHKYAMNRMAYFVKQLKLTAQGNTHVLRDLFVLHHRHSDSQQNNFVLWRNRKNKIVKKSSFSFARQSENGHLEHEASKEFKHIWAYETIMHYLSLGTQQQSYIEAPALSVALPEAFDDSNVRTHCTTSCMDRTFTRKHLAKIWKLLGM